MDADESTRSLALPPAPWDVRGDDMGRILSLSDGIFAFAMTLLVLGLVVPAVTGEKALVSYLTTTFLGALFAYVLTFFIIAQWWQAHQLMFSFIKRFDRRLISLNVLFLIFIAVLPFATGILTVAGGSGSNGAPVGVVFFAIIEIFTGGSLALLWLHASRGHHLVPSHMPQTWIDYLTRRTLTTPLVFAISIPIAFVNTSLAEISWIAIFFVSSFWHRQARTTAASGDPPGRSEPAKREPLAKG